MGLQELGTLGTIVLCHSGVTGKEHSTFYPRSGSLGGLTGLFQSRGSRAENHLQARG